MSFGGNIIVPLYQTSVSPEPAIAPLPEKLKCKFPGSIVELSYQLGFSGGTEWTE